MPFVPLAPKARYEGTGGTIELDGTVIGRLGDWAVQYWGDDRPYLSAQGCQIAAFWVSAGPERLTARPQSGATGQLVITGDVKRLTTDALSLGNLTIEGATDTAQGADRDE